MRKTPAPRRKLTILSLAAATYFMVSGGPYGMEELVRDTGYKLAILILFVGLRVLKPADTPWSHIGGIALLLVGIFLFRVHEKMVQ